MRVAVITATWQRHDVLINRCIPSVLTQTFPEWEHIVVSDGPDPELDTRLRWFPPAGPRGFAGTLRRRLVQLDEHEGKLGAAPRNRGVDETDAELVAFLDDDNAYRPRALDLLVRALDAHPDAGFAYGGLWYPEWGRELDVLDPPQCDHIDGSTFVARRELFDIARWDGSVYALDWLLISRWLAAGVGWVRVPEIVLDYWWARR